jgi:hypothetical protein
MLLMLQLRIIMKATIKNDKLSVVVELDPKEFKKGKKGWFKQGVTTVNGHKVKFNFIAYKDSK